MNIPTANIFIAFDRETMQKLFYSGATYQSLVKQLSDENLDGLLFDNVSNPNFISFEHTHGMGSGFKMKLSFIDPQREFEKRFITTSPLDSFVGAMASSVESTVSHVVASNEETRKSQKDYEGGDVSKRVEQIKRAEGTRRIYLAYGTGNNLDLWSGPHAVVIGNATVSVKGSRQITLELIPIPSLLDKHLRRGSYNEQVDVNTYGQNVRFSGESQEIKFVSATSYDPTEYIEGKQHKRVVDQYRDEAEKYLSKIGFEKLSEKIKKYDFHTMVVDTIRSYVQKATNNKNVVVVLPDLNIACRYVINDIGRETGAIEQGGGGGDSGGNPGSHGKGETSTWEDKSSSDKGKDELFVRGVLSEFGMGLASIPKSEDEGSSSANGKLNIFIDIEKNANAKEAAEGNYENNFFYSTMDAVSESIPDHKSVLKTVFSKITKCAQEGYKPSAFFYGMMETNTSILKLWGNSSSGPRWAKHYPFAGYDDFYDDGPAVVVGDVALIREYLYGGVDLNEKKENVKKLKDEANKQEKKEEQKKEKKEKGKKKKEEEKGPSSEDLNLAAAMEIPLHPMDRVLLANTEYNKKIREVIFNRRQGAFGDISYIPDTFTYRDVEFSEEEKDFIQQEGIPVFRYNTKNPNVMDMSFKFSNQYFQSLNMGFLKQVTRLASAGTGGALPEGVGSFRTTDRGTGIGLQSRKQFSQGLGERKRQNTMYILAQKIAGAGANFIASPTPDKASDTIAALLEHMLDKNLHGNILVDQHYPGTPYSILTDLAEDLYRKARRMDIQTLPMFHISELHNISHAPCIVFAQDAEISQSIKSQGTALSQFYSGIYKIIGYSHKISSNDVSSRFALTKQIVEEVEGQTDEE